jgi:hypothetical protein
MKTTKKISALLLILAFLSVTTYSCRKDIYGCMDPNSVNYDATATKDNGTCAYDSDIIFWWTQATAQDFQSVGQNITLKVYIDGVFKGTLNPSLQYWNTAPDCGATGALTCKIDLGSSKSKSISIRYEMIDGSGTSLGDVTESTTVNANTCMTYEVN